jgi:4-amino-4-deoxychorismate lyase
MSRLIESIKLYNGVLFNLPYHQDRVDKSLRTLHVNTKLVLSDVIQVPENCSTGLFKCRVVYSANGIHTCSFENYERKKIKKLKLLFADDMEYSLKWEDRTQINKLLEKRADADDIIMVKNDKVTDSSYANLCFKKNNRWYTPSTPLLEGIMRRKLLDENKILPTDISYTDIQEFECCKLINAMLEFDGPEIAVADIVL